MKGEAESGLSTWQPGLLQHGMLAGEKAHALGGAILETAGADPIGRPTLSIAETSGTFQQTRAVIRGLAPFASPHWRWFVRGAIAAFAVVAARLSLPWPLRAVADRWGGDGIAQHGLLAWVPPAVDPVIAMGALFLILVFVLGLCDYRERLNFARFAIGTVDDLRNRALATAMGGRAGFAGSAGDLVSRFFADSPRIKSGMQGFLVHVMTSGILIVGMTAVLFKMDATLGYIFLLAGLATVVVTGWAAARIFKSALLRRERDGDFANRIHAAINDDVSKVELQQVELERGGSEAAQTKLEGIATWTTHGIFGTAVLSALWVGANAVESGRINVGDMVVFMMYALMLQSPIVRLARQGAKTGTILSAAYRLLQIFPARKG